MKIILRNGYEKNIDVETCLKCFEQSDFIRWYDALPKGDPNKIELLDLAFPAFLGAVPNFKKLLDNRIFDALGKASELLCQIPTDISLVEWPDTESNRKLLKNLFISTTGGSHKALPGFGAASCTKMLHKKRPELIPIIDSWQLEMNGKSKTGNPSDMVDVVFNIRKAIIPQVDELKVLGERLMKEHPLLPKLSIIRLYDILFWKLSSEKK